MMNKKKLAKSTNKVIAGVCAGLAEYFGWDIALVRIAYLLLSILSAAFPGMIVYTILWIIMPEKFDYQ
ncbi:MAG: PspC domain-containing protein [Bacteroidales bacterium]|jgi:phage shock protein C|nr:PspC domain-containing protein [Bacteroidales bacterium]